MTSLRLSAPKTSIPSISAASPAEEPGKIHPLKPSFFACSAIGRAPDTGLSDPSRANSPNIINSLRLQKEYCPVAARIPTAIARSNEDPSFFKSAGAIFTIIFLPGILAPTEVRAVPILCWLSLTALSGRPTR
ncbi:hypothetical protein SDC9_59782 [bioreactor metagenome]|uniref:Uncharacterized protein n=1 Tax=bioreactor metagenome TaxID=1076179 RepID=A0A644XB31_9ZZZZ